VTPDVATAVKNAKAGQVRYRVDKAGIVHATIGRANFETSALKENLVALLGDLQKAKPAASKGIYLKRITVSRPWVLGSRWIRRVWGCSASRCEFFGLVRAGAIAAIIEDRRRIRWDS